MGMFSKVIAFLDKAAGVPLWITHAENIRKLEERGCPSLARAIVENEILWPLASYSLEEMLPQLAGMVITGKVVADDKALGSEGLSVLAYEVVAAYEGPTTGPIEVLQNFLAGVPTAAMEVVEVDAPSSLVNFAEANLEEISEVLSPTPDAIPLDEQLLVQASATPGVVNLVDLVETLSLTGNLSDEENLATAPGVAIDPRVREQLVHGMMKVISRGRKPGSTLKVLKTMSGGDQAAILEALNIMEAKGNTLAKAILEDPSL